jgi:hypothetical protein
MAAFEDIKIIGFDDTASAPSGDGDGRMRMVLNLSRDPRGVWSSKFNKAWASHMFAKKRTVSLSGATLIVVCAPEELQDQIDELKKVFSDTNAAVRDYIARDEAAKQAEAEKAAKDREALSTLKRTLRFD